MRARIYNIRCHKCSIIIITLFVRTSHGTVNIDVYAWRVIVSRGNGPAKSVFTRSIYPCNYEREHSRASIQSFLRIFGQTNLPRDLFIGRPTPDYLYREVVRAIKIIKEASKVILIAQIVVHIAHF